MSLVILKTFQVVQQVQLLPKQLLVCCVPQIFLVDGHQYFTSQVIYLMNSFHLFSIYLYSMIDGCLIIVFVFSLSLLTVFCCSHVTPTHCYTINSHSNGFLSFTLCYLSSNLNCCQTIIEMYNIMFLQEELVFVGMLSGYYLYLKNHQLILEYQNMKKAIFYHQLDLHKTSWSRYIFSIFIFSLQNKC